MTIGEMTQFSAYVSIIYGPLRWLSFLPRRLTRLMTSIVKIFDVIDEAVDVADKEDAIDHDIDGTITLTMFPSATTRPRTSSRTSPAKSSPAR